MGILVVGTLLATLATAQDTCCVFWVSFVDKGPAPCEPVALSPRALARRLKVGAKTCSEDDCPLYLPYVREVAARVQRIRHQSRWLNALSVEATRAQAQEVAGLPFVRGVWPVPRFRRNPDPRSRDEPPDPGAAAAQLRQIRVDALHRLGYSGRGVLVCLLDTGFSKSHPCLRGLSVVAERDFVFDDADTQRDPANPQDYSDGHGTSVWSAMAGFMPGTLVGPAYGASFLLAKTEDLRWELPVEEDHWVAAVEWADSLGADVVSSSLAYTTFDDGTGYSFFDLDGNTAVTTIAADKAASLGIAVVVAAGNYRGTPWGHIGTPADADSVIAVGAVDAEGRIAGFSSPGPTADGRIKPEVCARGVATACAVGSGYGWASGTSLSTPLVAGAAALLLEINPSWTGMDVRAALMRTASRAQSPDNDYGWGIVDALAASGLRVPLVEVCGVEVDDDGEGASAGNGNGTLEPGERVEVVVSLTNTGTGPTGPLTCTLIADAPAVEVVTGLVQGASMNSRDTLDLAPFVLEYAPWGPADTVVGLSLRCVAPPETLLTWDFSLPVARLFAVSGWVEETDPGCPVPAVVRVVGVRVDTLVAAEGTFRFWAPPGRVALQARASGFLFLDATVVDVPAPGPVVLRLARPSVVPGVDSLVVCLPGDSSTTWEVPLAGRGSGVSRFGVQAVGGGTVPGGPFRLVRTDPLEGGPVDLTWVELEATPTQCAVRLGAHDPLPGGALLWVGLDVDADPANGLSWGGISCDHLVEISSGARLLTAAGSRWVFVGTLEGGRGDTTAWAVIPTSALRNPTSPFRCVVGGGGTMDVPVELVPDDGGSFPMVVHLGTCPWLHLEPSTFAISPGETSWASLRVDARGLDPGTYAAHLLFQGAVLSPPQVRVLLSVEGGQPPAQTFWVGAPVPNPARDACRISLVLPHQDVVRFTVSDLAGRTIRRFGLWLPAGPSAVPVSLVGWPRGAWAVHVASTYGSATRVVVRW